MSDTIILMEKFNNEEIDKSLRWFSEPNDWKLNTQKSQLTIKPDKQTDFWQKTHYGFQVDNGHFLYDQVEGDFRLTTKVKSKPMHRYDQAGLMVRVSSDSWIKTSLEFIPDGKSKLGAVVTNAGYSDWSSQEIDEVPDSLYFRISKKEITYYVDFSLDGTNWSQIRMSHLFTKSDSMNVGIYACSPKESGYEVNFDFIKIERIKKDTEVYG